MHRDWILCGWGSCVVAHWSVDFTCALPFCCGWNMAPTWARWWFEEIGCRSGVLWARCPLPLIYLLGKVGISAARWSNVPGNWSAPAPCCPASIWGCQKEDTFNAACPRQGCFSSWNTGARLRRLVHGTTIDFADSPAPLTAKEEMSLLSTWRKIDPERGIPQS